MPDDSRDDADNEITRIVRRPGPAQLPINLMRPAGNDAIIPPPVAASPANDSGPPVAPPNMFDRPRPVMTPPPRPVMTPPLGGSSLGGAPIGAPVPPAPPVGGPTPVVVRPTPPVSLEPRVAPLPSPIAAPAPSPLPGMTPAPAPVSTSASTDHSPTVVSTLPVAEPSPVPPPVIAQPEPVVVVPVPEPVFTPAPIVAEAPKPFVRPAPIAAPVPAPVVAAAPAPVLASTPAPTPSEPVVGWLVIVKGPGRGTAREMVTGRNPIGSASGQAIRLDFGDPAIAPQGHAYLVYDEEDREFFVEDGKQKVVVRLNGKLLTETMPIRHGDELRIGATTLRFVALCGPDFDWHERPEKPAESIASEESSLEEKSAVSEENTPETKSDEDRSDVWHANPDSID